MPNDIKGRSPEDALYAAAIRLQVAIGELDKARQAYRGEIERLLTTGGVPNRPYVTDSTPVSIKRPAKKPDKSKASRLEPIITHLRRSGGPETAVEIAAALGITRSTVFTNFRKHPNLFKTLGDGLWELSEKGKNRGRTRG